jgi:hypothetical protein
MVATAQRETGTGDDHPATITVSRGRRCAPGEAHYYFGLQDAGAAYPEQFAKITTGQKSALDNYEAL